VRQAERNPSIASDSKEKFHASTVQMLEIVVDMWVGTKLVRIRVIIRALEIEGIAFV
jgi:hypothetical protein